MFRPLQGHHQGGGTRSSTDAVNLLYLYCFVLAYGLPDNALAEAETCGGWGTINDTLLFVYDYSNFV
jgi:hypothetical protein